MYCLMVCSSTVPQKYPRAHKCCPQYRFRNSGLLEADRLKGGGIKPGGRS